MQVGCWYECTKQCGPGTQGPPPACVRFVWAYLQVGCYYMCTKQYEQARRYFGKATGLEPNCAAAWIAFGHAFSAQDERDQVRSLLKKETCQAAPVLHPRHFKKAANSCIQPALRQHLCRIISLLLLLLLLLAIWQLV